jgi:hypothetical protein
MAADHNHGRRSGPPVHASFTTAMIPAATTITTIATCTQIQNRDTVPEPSRLRP